MGDLYEVFRGIHKAQLVTAHVRRHVAVSFFLLARATKTLPLGTAYAVWTGIGALGSVIVGIILFKEPVTTGRLIFAALLLIGIIGLKITSA